MQEFESTDINEQEEINESRNGLEIAIVGLSGRFPGAGNVNEFWENLKNGTDSIRFFTEEELLESPNFDAQYLEAPNYVPAKGVVEDVEFFDAYFFGYSPMEAEVLDPQIRLFYEVCWEAMEDAACTPAMYDGTIGVYAGGSSNVSWEVLSLLSGKDQAMGTFQVGLMRDKDYLSTRIAYKLDLKGPAISIHTACSTALVAIDLACRGLLTGQCDAALAGGVSVLSESARGGGYLYEKGLIYSKDGYVHAFDKDAAGVIFSHGAGAVLLKRLDDAIAEGDSIYAMIKGFASNNDGLSKSSFSAPAINGQASCIQAAIHMADIEPETVTYVETHGTGTELGDPIEVEALKTAFDSDKRQFCAIGSLKTNIGHLDTAAGVASMIKVALMMKHRQIPASLHFKEPNPRIDFENSPFFVNTQLRDWEGSDGLLRAGVSSFGVGGTNAHVILEEPPVLETSSAGRHYQPLLLSARTTNGLAKVTENMVDFLRQNRDLNPADVAYTLNTGRKTFEHKRMLVCSGIDDMINQLETVLEDEAGDSSAQDHYEKDEKRAVFMFPGQGSQYRDMGRNLYDNEPVFREEMDKCFEILSSLMDVDIKEILYPADSSQAGPEDAINQTFVTQPLLFAFEYSLARLLMGWGIRPYAMMGHSIGEYIAACLSEVFTLENALKLVVWRGKLMQDMPSGAMLSVPMALPDLQKILPDRLEIAAVNGPAQCVVSGTHEAVDDFAETLEKSGQQFRKLHTSHAFHSRMMDPILKTFGEKVKEASPSEPQIPFVSNVTGTWISVADATSPDYWVRHLRGTVNFSDGAAQLLEERHSVFIEVGPGRTLSTFLRQHTDKKPEQQLVNLVRHPKEDIADDFYFISRLAQAWLFGYPVDWREYYGDEHRQRLHLPTYPFQRQPFWLNGNPTAIIRDGVQGGQGIMGAFEAARKNNIEEWFYAPSWKPSAVPAATERQNNKWLVLANHDENAQPLLDRLIHEIPAENLTIVSMGETFEHRGENIFTLSPGQENDYDALLKVLEESGNVPDIIVHAWMPEELSLEDVMDAGFYSLLYLSKTLISRWPEHQVEINLLTHSLQEVWAHAPARPEQAVVMGPMQVIPLEYPNLSCRCIDVPDITTSTSKQVYRELLTAADDEQPVIAYRSHYRFVKAFDPLPIDAPAEQSGRENLRLKEKGIYLITGGLGGIGLVLGQWLAKEVNARLVLTGRSAFPERCDWDQWLDTHASLDPVSQKIRKVKELEALGAKVRIFSVDVSDTLRMRRVVDTVSEEWGEINGVIHSAGAPGGGIIQLKTREMADRVLRPKVNGALVLAEVLEDHPLDFFILCSSVNSVVPVIGQVDYFAGNAFMDAFSFYQTAASGGKRPTFSINWDAWQEVGMAVDAARRGASGNAGQMHEPQPLDHPLLDHYQVRNLPGTADKQGYTFTTYFSVRRHWVMSEHRSTDDNGIVPGVTYLEMAHAALQAVEKTEDGMVEIRDVSFHTPLIAPGEMEKETVMTFTPLEKEEGFEFHAQSRVQPGENRWEKHVTGKVNRAPVPAQLKRHDIDVLKERCDMGKRDIALNWGAESESQLLRFGPRWGNLRTVLNGNGEGLAFMELPEDYFGEMEQFTLYPSLLDIAAAFMSGCVTQRPYIPYSYDKLRVYRPLPGRFYAYGKLAEPFDENGNTDFIRFNVVLMDLDGVELVEIEGFTMMEISEEILTRLKAKEQGTQPSAPEGKTMAGESEGSDYNQWIKNGIAPHEGVEAFKRILSQSLPQVVVSTRDLDARFQASRAVMTEAMSGGAQEAGGSDTLHARPDIGAPFVEPGNEVEEKLARIWQELLGIEEVGVKDDFFELGGDSLKAATLIGKVKQTFNSEISVTEIFSNPNIRALAGQLAPAAEETAEAETAYQPIPAAPPQPHYPLSPMQTRIFVLSSFDRTATSYHLPYVQLLNEKPDIERLHDIFATLIRRHESLRTSFRMEGEQPVQVVHEAEEVSLEIRERDYVGRQEEPEALVRELIQPFDLEKAPLMRISLVALDDGKHLVVFDVQHIIVDGYSYMIIIREFRELMMGKPEPEELAIQYKDYAVWLTGAEGQAAIAAQEAFWLEQFCEPAPILNLPTDYPRPALQRFDGDIAYFTISAERTRKLKDMAHDEGTTLFMLLLAAYYMLPAKLAGQEDIVIGTPVAGRDRPEIQEVVGMFVNTLGLRNYPAPQKTFREFLAEVKTNTLAALENQGYPFEVLVEKISPRRDASRNPVFDIMFNMQTQLQEWEDTTGQQVDVNLKLSKFDLTLTVIEENRQLKCSFEYCTHLFKRETMERFISYQENILAAILKDPEVKGKDMEMMSPREKEQLLVGFNDTASAYPQEKTLHHLFDEQARRTPDNIAVYSSPSTYTSYSHLNHQSSGLAGELTAKGIGPGHIVALKATDSAQLMPALLGILKAGAAYLPIAPDYPRERIDYMLKDSNAKALMEPDRETDEWQLHNAAPAKPMESDHAPLAYVLYTSGSTGKPKGVMVEHRQVVNLVHATQERAYADRTTPLRIVINSPLVFDASVLAIYPALLGGHTLYMPPAGLPRFDKALLDFYRRHAIESAELTPTHLRGILASEIDETSLPLPLKYLFLGGEELPVALPRQFYRRYFKDTAAPEMFNSYGPTECCVTASMFRIEPEMTGPEGQTGQWDSVSIGCPLPNQQIYIIDGHHRPQPTGVAGELVIAGNSVSRGYLNNPQLTAEKFVSLPFSPHHAPAYKTGDLACWLPEGNLLFLGRIDDQVKIRGFRIELGEIRAGLASHESVKDVEVLLSTGPSGDTAICAYVVAQGDGEPDVGQLRDHLSRQLPQYMIPAHFVLLEQMPVTASGKIDRQALPLPGQAHKQEYTPPRDEKEERMAAIFSSVLGISRIGIYDNFFEMGGDSIKAVQISARLKGLGLNLDLNDMFVYSDIGSLSPHVTELIPEEEFTEPVEEYAGLDTEELDDLEDDLEDID